MPFILFCSSCARVTPEYRKDFSCKGFLSVLLATWQPGNFASYCPPYYYLRTAGGVVCSAGTAGRKDRWSLRRKCMQIRLASCVIITQSCRSRPSMDVGNSSLCLCSRPRFEVFAQPEVSTQLARIPTLRQQLVFNNSSLFHVK